MYSPSNGTPSGGCSPPAEASNSSKDALQGTGANQPGSQVEGQTLLTGSKLVVAVVSLYCCMALVALDQLILCRRMIHTFKRMELTQAGLATSSPRIVSDFNALDDVAWLTTSFFVYACSPSYILLC
jgi:hypothetical protein